MLLELTVSQPSKLITIIVLKRVALQIILSLFPNAAAPYALNNELWSDSDEVYTHSEYESDHIDTA